jgi:endonuclease/exonuclease/phosphatase family metal-dependent hydrolase
MRIVSYNIMNGGEGRADPLAEVILAQRPDIVALVESENLTVVERIAHRLGLDYIQGLGNKHASTILSRWPIRASINHAPLKSVFTRSCLEATIVEPGGEERVIVAVHLHPYAFEADEQRRQQELHELLGLLARHRDAGRPHLLVGDFNANSPVQKIDPEKCRPKTQEAWKANGGDLPRRVVQSILDVGYVDSCAAVNPELAATGASFTTQFPGQRLDYVFTHNIDPRRLASVWIESDRLATYASDHYLVGLEIAPL